MALMDFLKKVKNVAETVSSVAQQVQNSTNAPATEAPVAPAPDCYSFRGSVDDYFAKLIVSNFPQLRVSRKKRVAGYYDVPASFLLYQNGEPKLAIILCHSERYRERQVQNTVDACIARNIPYQRYFRDYRNEASYVVNRIRSAL